MPPAKKGSQEFSGRCSLLLPAHWTGIVLRCATWLKPIDLACTDLLVRGKCHFTTAGGGGGRDLVFPTKQGRLCDENIWSVVWSRCK